MCRWSVVERKTATDPGMGWGGGVAARISSKIRPLGGAARIAAPRRVVDIKVTNSPELSVVEPPSVSSRISVVLVEEAKVGGHSMFGVLTCGSGSTFVDWSGEAGQCDCL